MKTQSKFDSELDETFAKLKELKNEFSDVFLQFTQKRRELEECGKKLYALTEKIGEQRKRIIK